VYLEVPGRCSKFVPLIPFNRREPIAQRPIRTRDIGPHPDAVRQLAGSLVRVNQVPVGIVADLSPGFVKQDVHEGNNNSVEPHKNYCDARTENVTRDTIHGLLLLR
jgi:hypothetical protein